MFRFFGSSGRPKTTKISTECRSWQILANEYVQKQQKFLLSVDDIQPSAFAIVQKQQKFLLSVDEKMQSRICMSKNNKNFY